MKDARETLYASNDYLAVVDIVLRAAGDIFRTVELALLAPQVILPLCSKSDRWTRVVRPLVAPAVQYGLFPSRKAAAINSRPAPTLSVGCSA